MTEHHSSALFCVTIGGEEGEKNVEEKEEVYHQIKDNSPILLALFKGNGKWHCYSIVK